jgi:iron complex outermembrane receptor protein
MGIEWINSIQILKNLEWTANATWSINKVKKFYEYVDNYDSSYQEINAYSKTEIAFSPSWIAGSSLTYTPIKNGSISFVSKYVGKQFLDNTENNKRSLDAYLVNDVRLTYSLFPKAMKEILLSLSLNNIFNEAYESNGYTYNYISGGKLQVENFYFPQAGFNFMGGVTLKF